MAEKNYRMEALAKIEEGMKKTISDRKAEAMKSAVGAALIEFVTQDEEFAQAVAQGGSFENCMYAVARGAGTSISDLEAYKKAVQFYFPGAEIRMEMHIDLIGAAAGDAESQTSGEKSDGIVLDIMDFL